MKIMNLILYQLKHKIYYFILIHIYLKIKLRNNISLTILNVILDIYNLNNSKRKDINNNIISINKTTVLTNNNQNEIFINKLVNIKSSLIKSQINTSNTISIIENKKQILMMFIRNILIKKITLIQVNINDIKYFLLKTY